MTDVVTSSRQRLPSGSPARWAGYLGLVCGTGLVGFGLVSIFFASPPPRPLSVALMIAGAVQLAVCMLSLQRVRAAWSFALSLNGVAFVVFLLGAPKLRDIAGGVAIALVPAAVFGTVALLFALSAQDF